MNQVDSIRYWRTLARAEVDFILELGRELVPIEVKYSLSKVPKISRGFRNFLLQYQPERALVLTIIPLGKNLALYGQYYQKRI